jgi:eukaryotic-like serine/threonine-protein kinase
MPVVKTGVTNSGGGANPPPLPPVTAGLHAPAPTPGPVVQEFVTLGRYQLLSRLAVGGMAEVYLARQGELSGFKTLVVVKKVLPHLAAKPDFINMFLDEARIASMLDHPNIVRITEVGRTESEYFLAMELVQGKPLSSILQQSERAKTPLPHNLGALIVANAAAGLHHAHQLTDASGNLLGLVHRDISPQNIMVSFEGSVKVIDFGIARALGRLGDTNSGSLKGKLGYMAPEQARGEPVDARADIFSLGVVLWECVAGRRLFLRENELATLRAVVYEPIPSASKFAQVDTALDAIVRRATARNSKERFQTAEEMRIALEQWVFTSGGASTHDLSTLMKSWFPSDHLQWQRAARLALDMQESDPPIDVAFPNLAASRSGHSRSGSNRSEGTGSASKLHWDSISRSHKSQSLPPLALPSLALPPPHPEEVPDLRPKFWHKVAIPFAIVLSILAGGAVIFFLYGRKPSEELPPEAQSVSSVRPKVETLSTVEGTKAEGPKTEGANAERNTDSKSEPSAPSTAALPRSPEREMAGSIEGPTQGKKKNHASSGGKRAILQKDDDVERGSGKRSTPYEDKYNIKKNKSPRPNPF